MLRLAIKKAIAPYIPVVDKVKQRELPKAEEKKEKENLSKEGQMKIDNRKRQVNHLIIFIKLVILILMTKRSRNQNIQKIYKKFCSTK